LGGSNCERHQAEKKEKGKSICIDKQTKKEEEGKSRGEGLHGGGGTLPRRKKNGRISGEGARAGGTRAQGKFRVENRSSGTAGWEESFLPKSSCPV